MATGEGFPWGFIALGAVLGMAVIGYLVESYPPPPELVSTPSKLSLIIIMGGLLGGGAATAVSVRGDR